MDRRPIGRPWLACTVVVLLAAAAGWAQSRRLLTDVRIVLLDALSPGRLAVMSLAPPSPKTTLSAPADSPKRERNILEQQRRRLLIENARLRNELRLLQRSSGHRRPTETDFLRLRLVEARILGRRGIPDSVKDLLIDAGTAHGLRHEELVLDASGIVLDRGTVDGVQPGHPVLYGTAVVGRIDRIGRWVSHVLPITDPKFSAEVQLIHHTAGTSHPGCTGLLEGTGNACRITGTPATASIAVGDEVVSVDAAGIIGPRFSYGRVIQAEFRSAGQWDVVVEPAVSPTDVTRVAVAVPRLNSRRLQSDRSAIQEDSRP